MVLSPSIPMVAVSLDTLQPLPQKDSEQFSDDCFISLLIHSNGDDTHTQYAAALFIHN